MAKLQQQNDALKFQKYGLKMAKVLLKNGQNTALKESKSTNLEIHIDLDTMASCIFQQKRPQTQT